MKWATKEKIKEYYLFLESFAIPTIIFGCIMILFTPVFQKLGAILSLFYMTFLVCPATAGISKAIYRIINKRY